MCAADRKKKGELEGARYVLRTAAVDAHICEARSFGKRSLAMQYEATFATLETHHSGKWIRCLALCSHHEPGCKLSCIRNLLEFAACLCVSSSVIRQRV
jgi:hypothetical protein